MQSPSSVLSAPTRTAVNYSAIRAQVPEGVAITVLHIGADRTVAASGTGPAPAAIASMQIGYGQIAAACFRQESPAAGELEQAILLVEDEIARVHRDIRAGSALLTRDDRIRAIAHAAGMASPIGGALSLQATERVFGRVAAVAGGTPPGVAGIPGDAAFAATVLILREFMQHMQFSTITVVQP